MKLLTFLKVHIVNYFVVCFYYDRGDVSESEGEMELEQVGEVVLPQPVAGRGNIQASKSAIRY